jgi:predicted PurR-regulated permease PerM
MNTEPQNGHKNWASAVVYLTLLIGFLVLNMKMIAPYALAILMGSILALLFFPYYKKLRIKNVGQITASLLVTIGITLLLIVPIGLFGLSAANQASMIAKNVSQGNNISLDSIVEKISHSKIVEPFIDDQEKLKEEIIGYSKKGIEKISTAVLGLVGSIPERLFQIFLSLLTCFFMLVDGRKLLVFLNDKIPMDWDVRSKLYGSFKNTAISVIWATIAAAAAQAAIMFFAFLTMGIPGAFLAGGATFIFAWIPFLGCVPVCAAGAIYLYTQDRYTAMFVMVGVGAFTGVIDNYIRPLILKGRDELHPLISLISIFGGIAMFGILGVFVGPIAAATLIALLQIWPTVGKRFGLTYEQPEIFTDNA